MKNENNIGERLKRNAAGILWGGLGTLAAAGYINHQVQKSNLERDIQRTMYKFNGEAKSTLPAAGDYGSFPNPGIPGFDAKVKDKDTTYFVEISDYSGIGDRKYNISIERFVPTSSLPEHMRSSTEYTQDGRFYTHLKKEGRGPNKTGGNFYGTRARGAMKGVSEERIKEIVKKAIDYQNK